MGIRALLDKALEKTLDALARVGEGAAPLGDEYWSSERVRELAAEAGSADSSEVATGPSTEPGGEEPRGR